LESQGTNWKIVQLTKAYDRGLGFLPEAFVGCLAVQSAIRTVVVVVVLPLLQLLGEDLGVVDDLAWERPARQAVSP
jgi:hypothetical protein